MNTSGVSTARYIKKNYKSWLWAYAFIAPAMLGLFFFMLYPLIRGFQLSFYDVGLMKETFIGLENYERLFTDERFHKAMWNTLKYTLGIICFAIPLSLGLAILVNQKLRGMQTFRFLYYIPVVTSMIAVSLIWRGLFTSDGLVNQVIGIVGIEPINWLTDERYALTAVIIMSVWKGAGFNMMVFLGGLQGISSTLYEAAEVEGASWFTKFRRITLPLLSPTIFFVMITTFINSFQVFEQAQILTDGGPKDATATAVLLIYENAFTSFKPGYASAQAFILFLVILIITIIQFSVQKRWVYNAD